VSKSSLRVSRQRLVHRSQTAQLEACNKLAGAEYSCEAGVTSSSCIPAKPLM
jgi:hypothetical protein